MDTHEDNIRRHYEGKVLPSGVAADILAEGEHAYRSHAWRFLPMLLTAAVLIVAFLAVDRYTGALELNDRILAEIAMNHTKQLDVEFPTAQYEALQNKLDRLDFDISPEPSLRQNHDLIGGRYCSIQGQLAAQLKLRSGAGRIQTLYVTRLTDDLESIVPQTTQHEGIPIRTWMLDDRFFCLAGSQ